MNRLYTYFIDSLLSRETQRIWLEEHEFLIGDLHNHCNISYGHGDLAHAIEFAQAQLDFFSVTGHFAWPDMQEGSMPLDVQQYHKDGFARLRAQWQQYIQSLSVADSPACVSFVSYEFHSFRYGDYTIVHRDLDTLLPDAVPLGCKDDRLTHLLKETDALADGLFCMPHHIGYKTGYRGIAWQHFNATASPLVEIMSMHGSAESLQAFPPYLHTMGPRSAKNTMQGGLSLNHRFGVAASTDHHNASPGSYGCGRTGLWATAKNRKSIYNGLCDRKTVALTGDPIQLVFFLDDVPLGSAYVLGSSKVAQLDAYVAACTSLRTVEVLKNNQVIYRAHPLDTLVDEPSWHGTVVLSLGWGEKNSLCDWDVQVTLSHGVLCSASPRFRGEDIVDPKDVADKSCTVPKLSYSESHLALHAATRGNSAATVDATQAVVLELQGTEATLLSIKAKGRWHDQDCSLEMQCPLSDLLEQNKVAYLHGFVSPALLLSQFHPNTRCLQEIHTQVPVAEQDTFYIRATTVDNNTVWSSPIWVSLT